jgi:hypothetical protein
MEANRNSESEARSPKQHSMIQIPMANPLFHWVVVWNIRVLNWKFCARCVDVLSPRSAGVVSLEPQPLLHGGKAAPRNQWVTVRALWYRLSDGLEGLRRIWGRFEGKGAICREGPFPVASSAESTPPGPGSNRVWLRPKACIGEEDRRKNTEYKNEAISHQPSAISCQLSAKGQPPRPNTKKQNHITKARKHEKR